MMPYIVLSLKDYNALLLAAGELPTIRKQMARLEDRMTALQGIYSEVLEVLQEIKSEL